MELKNSKSVSRKRTSTFFWLILGTFMMVSHRNSSYGLTYPLWNIGTGLVDGFPPGGVEGHDVCSSMQHHHRILTYLRRSKFSKNFHTISWQSESKSYFSCVSTILTFLFSHELYVYNNTLDVYDGHPFTKS